MRKDVQARIRDLSECMLRRPGDKQLRKQLQAIRKIETRKIRRTN